MSDPLEELAVLRGRRVRREPLTGGLSNRTWRVKDLDDPGFDVAVRIAGPSGWPPGHDDEVANHRAAARVGLAPELVVDDPKAMVVAMVPHGVALTAHDLGDPATVAEVGRLVRRLHDGPRYRGRSDLFAVRRGYVDQARSAGRHLDGDDEALVARIESALRAEPARLVPCHNDLVASNIIDDSERLWLIDFEYSGMGEAAFDLGNLWIQSTMTLEDLDTAVMAYSGRRDPELVKRSKLWGIAAGLTWPLWASLTEGLDPSAREWAAAALRRAQAHATDPVLGARIR